MYEYCILFARSEIPPALRKVTIRRLRRLRLRSFAQSSTNDDPQLLEPVSVSLPSVLVSNPSCLLVGGRHEGSRDNVGSRPATEIRLWQLRASRRRPPAARSSAQRPPAARSYARHPVQSESVVECLTQTPTFLNLALSHNPLIFAFTFSLVFGHCTGSFVTHGRLGPLLTLGVTVLAIRMPPPPEDPQWPPPAWQTPA